MEQGEKMITIKRNKGVIALREWEAYIECDPDLKIKEQSVLINPFTGEKNEVTKGTADYISSGETVGFIALKQGVLIAHGVPSKKSKEVAMNLDATFINLESGSHGKAIKSKKTVNTKLPKAQVLRINKDMFWATLKNIWDTCDIASQRIDALKARLSQFNGQAIKSFAGFYESEQKKLNHYKVWDLIYILNDGASDDSFYYFRDTLIMHGAPELINLVLKDPVKAAKLLANSGDLCFEYNMQGVIEEVYKDRAGKILAWKQQPQIKGVQLAKENIAVHYPELVSWMKSHD